MVWDQPGLRATGSQISIAAPGPWNLCSAPVFVGRIFVKGFDVGLMIGFRRKQNHESTCFQEHANRLDLRTICWLCCVHFCRLFSRGSPAAKKNVSKIPPTPRALFFFWTSEWHDECSWLHPHCTRFGLIKATVLSQTGNMVSDKDNWFNQAFTQSDRCFEQKRWGRPTR